jgi:diamine N-acetyltransferase
MVLTGRFVTLRPLLVADAERTWRWRIGDRAALLNPGASSVREQAAWIASRPDTEYNFVIELRSGEPVGMLSLVNVDLVHRRAEPARFLIGEPEAVKGMPVAIEALKLLYGLAFEQLGLHRIHGTVVAENRGMLKLHLYLGMKEEGLLRQHQSIAGRFHDLVCIGMMESEYRSVALPRMEALIGGTDQGTGSVPEGAG